MDKNKIIILALIVIIAALLVGIVSIMPGTTAKQDTNLTFKSKSKLTEGDSLKIMLTDVNGTPLSNQTVNVTITDKDESNSYYSVVTNEKGIGTLKPDKSAGKYNVLINYGGNENYAGSNATKKITVEKEVVEAKVTSTGSSSYDPGAFYSRQAMRTIYTGEVVDSPGGPMRHLGNNKWEPA